MQTRLKIVKRGVVALATLGLAASGLVVNTPVAEAVTPSNNRSDKIAVVRDGDTLTLVGAEGTGAPKDLFSCDDMRDPSWAPDNVRLIVYCATDGDLVVVDSRDGSAEPLADQDHVSTDPDPHWSPDGAMIVVAGDDGNLWKIPAPALGAGGNNNPGDPIQVTFDDAGDTSPTFSPDGSRIAFVRGGEIWTVSAAGDTSDSPPNPVATQQTDLGGPAVDDPSWGFGSGDNSRILFTWAGLAAYVHPNGELNPMSQYAFVPLAGAEHAEYSPDNVKIVASNDLDGCSALDEVHGGNHKQMKLDGDSCDYPTWGGTASPLVTPGLVASPSKLTLHSNFPGQTDIRSVTIVNVSGAPKAISTPDPGNLTGPQVVATLTSNSVLLTPVFQFSQGGTSCGKVDVIGDSLLRVIGPANGDPVVLPPGGSCTLQVAFIPPLTSGTFYGNIVVGDPLEIAVEGTVGQGTGENNDNNDPGTDPTPVGDCKLDSNKSKLDFGKVKKGKSAKKTITIKNKGDDTCADIDVDVTGSSSFSIDKNKCDDGLAPGKKCDIKVRFKPTSKSSKSGKLFVGDLTIKLKGKGK